MAVQPLIHAGNVPGIRKILTWTAPAIAIPGLRYTQDNHLQRKELFVRDASTYSIGALIFFGTEFAMKKGLSHFNIIRDLGQRDLAAFLVGLTANLLYAGIGAVRFSKAFSRYQAQKAAKKDGTQLTRQYSISQPQFLPFSTSFSNILPLPPRAAMPLFQTTPGMQYLV